LGGAFLLPSPIDGIEKPETCETGETVITFILPTCIDIVKIIL
jgi:hypothetical protein